jgi:hypothetical protein
MPFSPVAPLLKQVEESGIQPEIESVAELAEFASKYPYYKYEHVVSGVSPSPRRTTLAF